MEKIVSKLKELYVKWKRKRKLRKMDRMWEWYFGYCFDGIPPSVRLTHQQKEIADATKGRRGELISMINGYAQEHGVSIK